MRSQFESEVRDQLWEYGAMVAQETFNLEVVGSSPTAPTILKHTKANDQALCGSQSGAKSDRRFNSVSVF